MTQLANKRLYSYSLSMSTFLDAPCIFLDRDGTIIYDKHYLSNPDEVELLPSAVEGLALLQAAGCALVVLSNQSGVGRGYFDTSSVDAVNARMDALLQARGVLLTGILYCPHAPHEQCHCRKPAPGLAVEAARRWHLQELLRDGRCVSVGDKMSDVRLGQSLGGRGVLVLTGKGQAEAQAFAQSASGKEADQGDARAAPDHVAADLHQAARWILHYWKLHSGQKL